MTESHEEHPLALGKIVGNLHSLEMMLRLILAQKPGLDSRDKYIDDFAQAPVGTAVAVTDMTNYAQLRELVKAFNAEFAKSGRAALDNGLVSLRDALAHGRVFKGPSDEHFRIVKFSPVRDGNTTVVYNEVMSPEWFAINNKRVRDAIEIVVAAYNQQEAAAS